MEKKTKTYLDKNNQVNQKKKEWFIAPLPLSVKDNPIKPVKSSLQQLLILVKVTLVMHLPTRLGADFKAMKIGASISHTTKQRKQNWNM